MAVPRNRLSNARKNSRRSHHAKVRKSIPACPKCGAAKVPHHLCQACGTYGDQRS